MRTFGFPARGGPSLRSWLRRLPDAVHIERISREDLFRLLSIAWVSVNPTLCPEEDFGLSAIESMMLGVPVLCSDWGGLKDAVAHERTGFRMKTSLRPGACARLQWKEGAIFLRKLAREPELRSVMARAAARRARQRYSEEAFLRSLERILGATLSRSSRAIGGGSRSPFVPRNWIRPIYDECLRKGSAGMIYSRHPALFRSLYAHYASEDS